VKNNRAIAEPDFLPDGGGAFLRVGFDLPRLESH
jgi:hypothetical protein